MKLVVDIRDGHEPELTMDENGELKQITFEVPFVIVKREGTGLPNEEKMVNVRVGDTRPCSHCKEEKSQESYYIADNTTYGYQNTCIKCIKRPKNANE